MVAIDFSTTTINQAAIILKNAYTTNQARIIAGFPDKPEFNTLQTFMPNVFPNASAWELN
jgi:hypothetical protein